MLSILPKMLSVLIGGLAFLASADGFETGFWVWSRESVLTVREMEQLQAIGAPSLYWEAGFLRPVDGRWIPEHALKLAPGGMKNLALIPVFRLAPSRDNPLTSEAAMDLAERIRSLLPERGFEEAQIDFDCPDRLLPQYADFLLACRKALAPLRLSATALAGWSGSPAFPKLQESVDALFPMFYDLQPDAPEPVREGHVVPALDPESASRQIDSWHACRIPWHAGLPGFARVTIFDKQGKSRGHLHQWSWDGIAFNPALQTLGQTGPGVTLLRAERNCTMEETPLARGETVACRWPRLEDLRQAIAAARTAGAAGVTIFRLPEGGASGGWSLAQWKSLLQGGEPGQPLLRLTRTSDCLELTNISSADLPPRLAGPGGPLDRGWQVEIQAGGVAVFREASRGDFAAVHGHAQPDSPQPVHVSIPMAERLTFWLASLPAGTVRRSGLVLLAPDADPTALRWRIPSSPQNSVWHPLE